MSFFDGAKVDWRFSVRSDAVGITEKYFENSAIKSALKIIEIAMECNGVLYPVGIKHQKAKEGYSVCYFAILFKNDKKRLCFAIALCFHLIFLFRIGIIEMYLLYIM